MALGDRPTSDPRFAHDGTSPAANIVVPPSGKLDVGWADAEQPPAGFLNWWQGLMYQWVKYLACTPFDVHPPDGWVPTTATAPYISGSSFEGAVGSLSSGASAIYVPIRAPIGMEIAAIDVACLEPSANGENFQLTLFAAGDDGTVNQIADVITTGFTAADVTHTWDVSTNNSTAEMPYTVVSGTRLFIAIDFPQTTTNDESRVRNIHVTPTI